MEQYFQCAFRATNNEAEYEALIIGMRLLVELGAQDVEVRCDSQLVSKQIQGEYQANYRPDDWRSPIYRYLDTGVLPDDLNEARRIKQRASRYRIFRNELYRWSFAGIYQKCLDPEDSECALRETHEGECGNHSGSRSLVRNLLRAGYFWSKMQQDAQKFVSKCDKIGRAHV